MWGGSHRAAVFDVAGRRHLLCPSHQCGSCMHSSVLPGLYRGEPELKGCSTYLLEIVWVPERRGERR